MKILEDHRQKIDHIDDRIIDLLSERMEIIRTVGGLKASNDIPAVLPDRVEEVIERCAARAVMKHVDVELVRCIYTMLVDHCCAMEEEIISKK